jgi:hypothetical protein
MKCPTGSNRSLFDCQKPIFNDRERSRQLRFAGNLKPPIVIIRTVARSRRGWLINKTLIATDYFKTALTNFFFHY